MWFVNLTFPGPLFSNPFKVTFILLIGKASLVLSVPEAPETIYARQPNFEEPKDYSSPTKSSGQFAFTRTLIDFKY